MTREKEVSTVHFFRKIKRHAESKQNDLFSSPDDSQTPNNHIKCVKTFNRRGTEGAPSYVLEGKGGQGLSVRQSVARYFRLKRRDLKTLCRMKEFV